MAISDFTTRYGADDKAWAAGKRPDDGKQLSIFREPITDPKQLDNPFTQPRFNPTYSSIWANSRFGDDIAAQSQSKIDNAYLSTYSNFPDPNVKATADRFLQGYAKAVQTGFLPQDQSVSPDNLRTIVSQDAASRLGSNDPNVKGTFPSQGVAV